MMGLSLMFTGDIARGRAHLEEPAGQPACARREDNGGAGLGKRLEASSKVRGLTDHRLLLGCTSADQVAHHDESGGDADANL